ncbi:histidine kinase dimerization/phosphoacceptor domain -containing protein [Winogradskyella sp.]|uniref:histidine kinase dimerization/phosphoacceptor domain -containing protein n=1 Tax=Winogradskyella sp. TaxID=1883156 RepID=UPI00263772A7|nr:histidine kinase dimerization/phosphoacceptor domain -containing protein [Winogradskyella sp.]
MRKTLKIMTLVFISIVNKATGQLNSEKEKLLKAIDTTTKISQKIQLYADLSWEFILEENDSALFFADKALKLSKNNAYPLGEAIALETKGIFHEVARGNYAQASKHYFEGIRVCQDNNLDYEASIHHSLGVMFHTSDNYDRALEYYTKALELARDSGDKVLQKKCIINLGSVNSSLENFNKAAELMKASLEIPERKDLDYSTYANLGYLYVKQEKFGEALYYLNKSIEQHPDNPDSELNLYLYIHAKVKSKDTTGMTSILNRAKAAINAQGLRDKSLLIRNIADYYTLTKDYKTALTYRNDYIKIFEEIKEKQKDQIVLDIEAKYKSQQKDAELSLLQIENKNKEQQKRLYSILALVGLMVATLLGYFAYRNRKQKLKLAEQRDELEVTIKEKETLFKEIHHRVKNSLQMVSSLLFLQGQNIEDNEAKNTLKDAQSRVRSLGLIHQKLYNRKYITGVETQSYFTDLIDDVFSSHKLKSQHIEYQLDVENMVLSVDTLSTVGLILNELIVNVIKHAFNTESDDKKMSISFAKEKDILKLNVIDNGIGFDETKKDKSFGLKLIHSLSRKLDAQFNIKAILPKGTHAQLVIHDFEIIHT